MASNNTPKVGDGATISFYSDRRACTIVKVSPSGKTIHVQEDTATLLNGPKSGEPDALKVSPGGFAAHVSGTQRYAYEPDPTAPIRKATLRKNGRYYLTGYTGKGFASWSGRVSTDGRFQHYDYNY